jgi:putative permease
MSKNRRIEVLQYLAMATLLVIFLYYFNQLFSQQLTLLKSAITAIVLPFGIALFISYLLAPLSDIVHKYNPTDKKLVGVIFVLLISLAIIGLFGYFIGDIIYEQGKSFFRNDFEGIRTWIETTIIENETAESIYQQVVDRIDQNETPIFLNIVNILKSTVAIIAVIVLVPVFLFFLLHDKTNIFLGIVKIVPSKYQSHTKELGVRANEVIQKYFNGRFISMFIMSILFSIMFIAFGFSVQRSIFFGFLLGFLDIIPYIGGFIGILLPILYSFTIQDTLFLGQFTFIGLLVVNIILQAFQGNILQPYIMGKEVNLHPLLVLSSFIFFGALFGIVGVILAIPITGIIKTSVIYYREQTSSLSKSSKK